MELKSLENKMSTVETLRAERNGWTVPLTLFYSDFKASSDICYGFVEGKDDPSYYRPIIDRYLEPVGGSIKLYQSNGKKNVKCIYNELSKRNYPSNRISFFMDRDLSCIVDDLNLIEGNRVYITDNYSIENDILSEDTLGFIMQEILGFSSISLESLDVVKQRFKKERKNFESLMIPIMANIIFWKRNDLSPANYNNLNIKNLIVFDSNCRVSFRQAEEETIKILYSQSGVDYDKYYNKETIDSIIREIKERDLSTQILRGKYLSAFFVEYCNSLYEHCNSMGITRDKGRKLSARDIIETIAPRSRPPQSLVCFIKNTIMVYYNERCLE